MFLELQMSSNSPLGSVTPEALRAGILELRPLVMHHQQAFHDRRANVMRANP